MCVLTVAKVLMLLFPGTKTSKISIKMLRPFPGNVQDFTWLIEPQYGQGWCAFGERLSAPEGDQMTSCCFIYGVLQSVLHDDPRYFRRGSDSVGSRLWYAASRT